MNKKNFYEWLHQNKKCEICGKSTDKEIHHITHKTLSPRRDDFRVIVLCTDHHIGNKGIHHMGLKWYDSFMPLNICLKRSEEYIIEYLEETK